MPTEIDTAPANRTPRTEVIVRSSSFESAMSGQEADDLAFDIVDFVSSMIRRGFFEPVEINEKAMNLYCASYYYGEVMNGGHSQFIRNSGIAEVPWNNALEALHAMDALQQADILRRMMEWVEANPEEAERQTGFSDGRASYLDDLDYEFYAIDKTSSMIGFASRWALTWPELVVVFDSDYDDEITSLIEGNPNIKIRRRIRRTDYIEHQISDWQLVATGMALTAIPGEADGRNIFQQFVVEVDGQDLLACKVSNRRNTFWVVLSEEWTKSYEDLEYLKETKKVLEAPGAVQLAIQQQYGQFHTNPVIGIELSNVPARQTVQVIDLAQTHNAAVAMDLLLEKAGIDDDRPFVSASRVKSILGMVPQIHWVVSTADEVLTATTSMFGAALRSEWDNTGVIVANADREEIKAHSESYAGNSR